jgi:EmrB/QacA subfamily drug resistance transporter
MDALVLPIPHRDRAPSAEEQARFRVVFFQVAPAMFIGALDQAIVAAALPAIATSLGDFADIAWLVTAYLLAATVAAPIYGRLGDAFGRKRALLAAIGLFLAGSLACAVAGTLPGLICARAVPGLGGGGLMTLAQALIGEAVSPRERGRFQGWFGAIFALASTLGPVAGGALSQSFGWRSIFWVNVPLGFFAASVAQRLEASPGAGRFTPDFRGTPLFVGATVALLLSLSLGSSLGWSSAIVLVLAAVAVLGFGLLWPIERQATDPLLPPDLLRLPVVWRSAACVFLFASMLFALIVELPILLQVGFGVSPAASGAMLLPLTLAQVAVSTVSGARISTTGHPRGPMLWGLATAGVGFAVLAGALDAGPVAACAASMLVGVGLGTTMPAAQTMVQWASGSKRLGTATALLSFARSIGGVVGAALATAILLFALSRVAPGVLGQISQFSSTEHARSASVGAVASEIREAFRWVFGTLAVLGAAAALVARSIPDIDLATAPPADTAHTS